MPKGNTLNKVDATKVEHPTNETAEKQVDIRKPPDMEELKRRVAEEDGEVPPEQAANTGEQKIEEKTEEPKEAIPDQYKGKTPEELVKILAEKEKYIQSRSNEMGELKKKITDAEGVKKQLEEIEAQNFKQTQQPLNIPPPPEKPVITDDKYYENPVKALNDLADYQEKLAEYNKQYANAMVNPYYKDKAISGKEELLTKLEAKYKEYPVKFDRKKIQEFLDKNPKYFNDFKTGAYEKAYHDMSANEFSQNYQKTKEEMREQIKKELMEEMNTHKQAGNIGFGDLNTQPIDTGSSPAYDEDKMEEDPEYRDKVLADIAARNKK